MTSPRPAASRPLRVALVSDWFFPRRGGIEAHLLALAEALGRVGAEATVLTSFPGPPEVEGVAVDRLQTARLPLAGIAISPRLVGAIRERLEAGRYDLVHLHPSIVAPFCLAAVPAAHRLGLPIVLTFHSVMKRLPALLRLADRVSGWTGWNVALTAVSSPLAAQLHRAFPERRVAVLPNGFDRAAWADMAREGAPPGRLRLVTAMRLAARKRPRPLLRSFAEARRRAQAEGVALELTIAGDGPQRGAVEGDIGRLGLADAATLAGWLDREALKALYARSDLFVMPSVQEAFCIAALEARAAGLPVLARAGTGIADYILDGRSGVLAGSDEDMADSIVRLATDPQKLAALAADPGDLASYDWARLAAEHLALYERLLRGPSA